MNRIILTLTIEVVDMARAKTLRDALETTADEIPEDVKLAVRYDEIPEETN